MTTLEINNRIAELENQMNIEAAVNFVNGDLWNELSDKVTCLEVYKQENMPVDMLDEDGVKIGYKLEDGTEVYFEGMTFENSYN